MTGTRIPQGCPRCGNALLWNGRAMACIACSYLSTDVKSEKGLPAAKAKRKDKRGDGSSQT
ncbi:MAG TPA: hypothetical protein VMU54_02955 [Planctomycetota bacterium]|nr:hypothetical protein [Planctomycetota bacterium]